MNNLIIFKSLNEEKQTILASELYEFLELDKTHYSRWVKDNILNNPFVEQYVDVTPFMAKRLIGVVEKDVTEYELSIPFAKKLCMVSKSSKGEQVRNFFLDIEKRFNKAKNLIQNNLIIEQMLQSNQIIMQSIKVLLDKSSAYELSHDNINNRIDLIQEQVSTIRSEIFNTERYKNKVPAQSNFDLVTPTQIGNMYNPKISAIEVNKRLQKSGLQYKVNGEWIATVEGKKYCENIPKQNHKTNKIYYMLMWQRRIFDYLIEDDNSLFLGVK
jgi:phage anti-repressor protein